MINEILEAIKKHKSAILIALGLLMAIILLITSGCETDGEEEISDNTDFCADIERKLTELISALEGVGEVRVLVTMESGAESVYAYNMENSESSEKYSYFTDSDKKPILLKEIEPRVRGVAVICSSGDNPIVQREVIALVSSVLDIPTNRVFVGS